METLINLIKEKRNVKENTLNFYRRNLMKLSQKITGEDFKNMSFLKDINKVKKELNKDDYKKSTMKNYIASVLTAFIVQKQTKPIIRIVEQYREYLKEIDVEYQKTIADNKKTYRQSENWVSLEELKKVLKKFEAKIKKHGINKKDKVLNKKDKDILQRYTTLALYLIDDENPPIRLGYADMKVMTESKYNKESDEEKEKNNYLVIKSRNKKYFSLGNFKTKSKGKFESIKKLQIGSKLNTVLNLWLKHNPSGYLLLNSQGKPMSRNSLTKYLTSSFKKYLGNRKISSTMLRHIFITDELGESIEKIRKAGDKMLHSEKTQQKTYYKKNG